MSSLKPQVPPHVETKLTSLVKGLFPSPENHPILIAKGLHGAPCDSFLGDEEVSGVSVSGAIVAKIKDIDGVLLNLYFKCTANGNHTEDLTVPGAPIAGGFIRIGKPTPLVLVVEDLFCGHALHLATGNCVSVALFEPNVALVATSLRKKYPDKQIVICTGAHNNGSKQANVDRLSIVANHAKASIATPVGADTFYEMFTNLGSDAVASAIEAAVDPESMAFLSEVTEPDGFQAALSMWPCPVNGKALFKEIVYLIESYMSLPEGAAVAIALWIMSTHTIAVARVAPILGVLSPVPQCGKTTLLGLIMRLTYRAMASSSLTSAVLFRTIDAWSPTVVIDEADTFLLKSEELSGIINSGHTRDTAFVFRAGRGNKPERFRTFGPKVIAMIGRLPETVATRSITVNLQRKAEDELKATLLPRHDFEIAALRARISRWASDNLTGVSEAEFERPALGNDRTSDNWEPLLSIAHVIGGDCFEDATDAAKLLSRKKTSFSANGEDLLRDIKRVFDETKTKKLSTVQLIGALSADDESPWVTYKHGKTITPTELAMLLSAFDVKSKNLRVGDAQVIKGYERAQFEDAFSRYVPTTHK